MPSPPATRGEALSTPGRTWLWVECLGLFFVLPGLLYLVRHQLAFRVFFLLFGITLICLIILLKDPSFDRGVFRKKIQPGQVKSILSIFLPAAVLLSLAAYFVLPAKFVALPKTQPLLWLMVMVLYPPMMVLPQELLFRCYFFHRYRSLFMGRRLPMILVNALSFGLAHVFYGNWVAPLFSFFGGLLFAWRYRTTQALATVSLEHALWGNFFFTIGIGWYFYSGAIS
jgi:hypothetical protein